MDKSLLNSRRATIAAVAIFVASSLSAQWWSGNKRIPDEPWRKGKADFGAMLLLTPDVEKFYEEWRKPKTPTMVITKTAHRNRPITAVVLFTGCKARDHTCNIRVDFTVISPDRSEYGSEKNVAAWVNKPAAPRGVVQVSEATLGIVIEPKDQPGEYVVKAIVRDVNANVQIELEQPFTVEE